MIEVIERLLTAHDRAALTRKMSVDEMETLLMFLLSRAVKAQIVSSGDLLLLLIQRIDLALIDLDLADQFRIAPNITEPILRQKVSSRVETLLGTPPTDSLTDALIRRTRTAARRLANRGEAKEEAAVIEAAIGVGRQIRCSYCGYWFRLDDIRPALRDSISVDVIAFADDYHACRPRDEWKPVRTQTKRGETQQWTGLEIEHRIPETMLGESATDNLTVACRWCNQGKWAFRSYAEAIPGILAVSLGQLHAPWAVPHIARAFFTVVSKEGGCTTCSRGPEQVELSVEVPPGISGFRKFFAARVICYECRLSARSHETKSSPNGRELAGG